MRYAIVLLTALTLTACSRPPASPLTVAAAANLASTFNPLGQAFERETHTRVTFSFGATANLTQQIENGAPFDVFCAADTSHIDQLVREGHAVAGTRAIYSRGRLALWSPARRLARLEDVAASGVHKIAVARPELAPYGKASLDTLHALHLWDSVATRIVYAPNVDIARQYAETGNADAAFTAYSLVRAQPNVLLVPETLHHPIDQALVILDPSRNADAARRFVDFLLHGNGKSLLQQAGYETNTLTTP